MGLYTTLAMILSGHGSGLNIDINQNVLCIFLGIPQRLENKYGHRNSNGIGGRGGGDLKKRLSNWKFFMQFTHFPYIWQMIAIRRNLTKECLK